MQPIFIFIVVFVQGLAQRQVVSPMVSNWTVWVDSQIGNCPPNNSFEEDSNPEFFGGKFLPLGNKKKGGRNLSKWVFGKNAQSCHTPRKKKVELARFRSIVSYMSLLCSRVWKNKLLLLLTSSQIWLCPLLDDRWSTYPTKLKRINHVPFFYWIFKR